MFIVVVAMFSVLCHGSAVHYHVQDARNVDCSYAQTVMYKAEEGQAKLTDGEKKMIEVARVHCSTLSTSLYDDVLIRQGGPSDGPSPPTGPPTSTRPRGWTGTPRVPSRPNRGNPVGTSFPPILIPGRPPFRPRPVCPCTCSDKAWAEGECRNLRGTCIVTKMMCPHGKFMCCGIVH